MNRKIALSFLSSTFFVAAIIASPEEFNINSPINEWGWTQLHKLVREANNHDHFNTMEKFIIDNANVNARDNEGLTPLHHAAFMGHPESISILLRHGAHINDQDNDGWTPLHVAAVSGNFACLSFLINNGANVRAKVGEIFGEIEGCTPLHCAATSGSLACLTELLNTSANADRIARDEKGETPLHKAAKNGYLNCVKKLLNYDASLIYKATINFRNFDDKTPEILAEDNDYKDIADYLKFLATKRNSSMAGFTLPTKKKKRIL
ncbi:ankyrin repeat domain-containing protein [bacterium]|nr:MAG: ankyrin repeat domain-containing protein [bacterium]